MSRVAVFAAATLAWAAPVSAQTVYFGLMPDLPIAPGLAEMDASLGPMSYADGSEMFVLHASGAAAPEDVRRFYAESLSALGWAFEPGEDQELAYLRGRERLTLRIAPLGEVTVLRATLIVEPASMNAD
jgi:hypothetical protein